MRQRRRKPSAVFVYGTLMPGRVRYPAIEHFVDRSEPAVVRGQLYDTGDGYPAAIFAGGNTIAGFLLRLRPGLAGAAIATLDQIEGDLYDLVDVVTLAGDDAMSYEWAGDLDGLEPIVEWKGE